MKTNRNNRSIDIEVLVSLPKPNNDTRAAGDKMDDIKDTSTIAPDDSSIALFGNDTSPCFRRATNHSRNATDTANENRDTFATSRDIPSIGTKNNGKINTANNKILNATMSSLVDRCFFSSIKNIKIINFYLLYRNNNM